MSDIVPAPRIGKYAGKSASPVRKPPKARKPARPAPRKPVIQPFSPGLINR